MKLEHFYENQHILHVNTMPEHAYFVPASVRLEDGEAHRETSDRLLFLNGEWDFCYYQNPDEAEEQFTDPRYEAETFVKVPVPGTWQYYGYDQHQYTNVRYPFPIDPPYVPLENPCGAYRKEFEYAKIMENERVTLTFEGVDSCFYVWLNGTFVGYSQITHAQHEFDVSDLMIEGKNLLAVLVLKWCDGSYLEDQDKFRMSGIIRDVYLVRRPEAHIFDYRVRTYLSGICEGSYKNCDSAKVQVDVTYSGKELPVHAFLYNEQGDIVSETVFQNSTTLEIWHPSLWTAEQPILYTLYLETEKEIITERIGLRQITSENNVVKVNGHPVVFRGVNRHDSDPFTGPVIGVEQIIRDMRLMKEHNIHAIRSSHYPNAPYFYQLCDRYGFYVIDEADNESHGNWERVLNPQTKEEADLRWNEVLTDNPEYTQAITDRVRHLVIRDQNRPSVVIWSMGNEGGFGCTFEEALAWTKSFDPTRLTHYESAIYGSRRRTYDYSNLDLHSRMYPSISEIEDYIEHVHERPFVLCEYSHAMGNGPGDLEDYYQVFDQNPCMCGGFIWEWCDHAIYKGTDKAGKQIYYYGGDHGEFLHDGNFCMDGLVYPDRTPHKGLLELKNVNRPVRTAFDELSSGFVTIQNKWNDRIIDRNLRFSYEINGPKDTILCGEIPDQAIPVLCPGEQGKLRVPEEVLCFIKELKQREESGDWYFRLITIQNGDDLLTKDGHILGFDEVCIYHKSDYTKEITQDLKADGGIQIQEDERTITVSGKDFCYRFDKRHGVFEKLTAYGQEYLEKPMDFTVWRAPTDNDREIRKLWERAFYDHTLLRAYHTEWKQNADTSVCIICTSGMMAPSVQKILSMNTIWTIFGDGSIRMQQEIKKDPDFPVLPRFGIEWKLPEMFHKAEYTGMGPHESYRDKNKASWHGRFTTEVKDLHEDYIKPQENGSHYDCSQLTLTNGEREVRISGAETFSFQASPYTAEELTKKMHNFELERSGYTVLHLDYAQNGIGSNSCGPEVLKKYQFDETEFSWDIYIKII